MLTSVPVTRRLGKSNCVGDYVFFNSRSDKLAVCGGSYHMIKTVSLTTYLVKIVGRTRVMHADHL